MPISARTLERSPCPGGDGGLTGPRNSGGCPGLSALQLLQEQTGFQIFFRSTWRRSILSGLVSLAGTGPWATAGLGSGDITICCDTLVNILEVYGFSDADVVKLDIEGAELRALKDADRFFNNQPRTEVIFESNDHRQFFGYRRNDLLRWFEQRDFSLYAFRPDGLMPVKPDDPQPVPVIDILATRRSPASLEEQGEKIVLMTEDYIMQELLKISTSTDPAIRQHFITEARQLEGQEGQRLGQTLPAQ